MSFRKDDQGKLRMDLLSPDFLEGVAKILTLGAAKYGARNYINCKEPYERYYAALQRHLTAYARGELVDQESGESHLLHAACCLQFLYEYEVQGKLADHPRRSPQRDPAGP
jgi:hypothetical protein